MMQKVWSNTYFHSKICRLTFYYIRKYNAKSWLDYWGSCYANQIKGTDGTLFHPNVNSHETLFMFSPELCRSIYATFEKEEVSKEIVLHE